MEFAEKKKEILRILNDTIGEADILQKRIKELRQRVEEAESDEDLDFLESEDVSDVERGLNHISLFD